MLYKDVVGFLFIIIAMALLLIGIQCFEYRYDRVRKYYPGMTRWDYIILHEHLVIIYD